MFRAAGSSSTAGPKEANLYMKAIWLLWSSERENSFLTLENRRGIPAFPIVEVEDILFLSGRKLSDGPPFDQPSVHQQDQHIITSAQLSQYMVPVVNPWCGLGRAVAEEAHDEFCGASPTFPWPEQVVISTFHQVLDLCSRAYRKTVTNAGE